MHHQVFHSLGKPNLLNIKRAKFYFQSFNFVIACEVFVTMINRITKVGYLSLQKGEIKLIRPTWHATVLRFRKWILSNCRLLEDKVCITDDLYVFPCWRATATAVTNIPLEKIFLLVMIGEPSLQDKFYNRYAKFGWHCSISSPVLWHCRTNQWDSLNSLAKPVESFNLHWPKALLSLILLYLRSTPFGKHWLSPFKILVRKPIRLDQGMYKSALLRRRSDLL